MKYLGLRPLFAVATLITCCLLVKPTSLPAQTAEPEQAPVRVSALPNIDFGPHFVDLPSVQTGDTKGRAFGDTASGCFSAVFRLPVPPSASIEKITQGCADSLRTGNFEVGSVVHGDPEYNSATSFSFRNQSAEGLATLILEQNGPRHAKLLACYWNDRSPLHCAALCEDALKAYVKGENL